MFPSCYSLHEEFYPAKHNEAGIFATGLRLVNIIRRHDFGKGRRSRLPYRETLAALK